MTLLIHEVNKLEDLFLKDGTIPDPRFRDNAELGIIQTMIKRQLEGGDMDKWNKLSNMCMRVSEETSTVVHRLYNMEKTGTDHQKWESTRTEAIFSK